MKLYIQYCGWVCLRWSTYAAVISAVLWVAVVRVEYALRSAAQLGYFILSLLPRRTRILQKYCKHLKPNLMLIILQTLFFMMIIKCYLDLSSGNSAG